ncbi:hypothetical protein [Planococcus donghaensis]|uniref:DUF4129 domain-containing protein n=1 Tax=Planococcus donghaensis TaxID=414778 RepID=A0A1C7EG44_9BACL|nr:hypothetical protein [Planococcus donghaensis]ANU22748.1 hypothetical protein BCM40_04970 [Planococcus donghaensis]
MISRFVSFRYFMLDAFIVSLMLVFVEQPIVWRWIAIALVVSGSAYLLFSIYSYRLVVGIGISFLATLMMWFVGVPLWLALFLGMLIIYMLHGRYSSFYNEISNDHHFLVKFVVVFSVCWILLLLNPEEQSAQLLFSIVPVAILFYAVSQVTYLYSRFKSNGARLSQGASALLVAFSLASGAAIATLFIADEVRRGIGWGVGGAIPLLFWPLALLMERITKFLSGLSTEEEMQETIDKLGPEEKMAQSDQPVYEAVVTDYPVEILLGLVIFGCLIVLILWLRKTKPQLQEPIQENSTSIQRTRHQLTEPVVSTATKSLEYRMDLHQIREAFRELEKSANEQKLGRRDYETVREWVGRMKWDVSDAFYNTYDQIRYGDKQLPESQVVQFKKDIQKIKNDYLKEYV